MKAYYFRHSNGYTLAAIYAKSQQEAENILPVQHSWCNASLSNCSLLRVENGTEWDRICATK